MVLVLGGITLIAATCVGMVYKITSEPIAQAKAAAVVKALEAVLPEFDQTERKELEVDGFVTPIYIATKAGEIVGTAVEASTNSGFSGLVKLMVGFTPDSKVYNISVLEQSETPGLGTKMADSGNPLEQSFKGKDLAEMKQPVAVVKDGGDVDILTAATISSRAYVDAVKRAYNATAMVYGSERKVDSASGTTATAKKDETTGAEDAQEGEQSNE